MLFRSVWERGRYIIIGVHKIVRNFYEFCGLLGRTTITRGILLLFCRYQACQHIYFVDIPQKQIPKLSFFDVLSRAKVLHNDIMLHYSTETSQCCYIYYTGEFMGHNGVPSISLCLVYHHVHRVRLHNETQTAAAAAEGGLSRQRGHKAGLMAP